MSSSHGSFNLRNLERVLIVLKHTFPRRRWSGIEERGKTCFGEGFFYIGIVEIRFQQHISNLSLMCNMGFWSSFQCKNFNFIPRETVQKDILKFCLSSFSFALCPLIFSIFIFLHTYQSICCHFFLLNVSCILYCPL